MPSSKKGSSPSRAATKGRAAGAAGTMQPAAASSSLSSTSSNIVFTEVESMEDIPDIEEFQTDDLNMAVASAPEYKIQQLPSIQELDADLVNHKPFSTVHGVNIRGLCKFMSSDKHLVEKDELWDWETIFTEISSEFRKDIIEEEEGATSHKTTLEPPLLPPLNTEPSHNPSSNSTSDKSQNV